MEEINIKLGDKEFKVKKAGTEEEKRKGLMNVESLPEDSGMLFCWDKPQKVSMWMHNTKIPLDIIFINEDQEVSAVKQGKPDDDTLLSQDDTLYVVELNKDSGVKVGDTLDLEDEDGPVMKVLAPDGSTQMELWGGERIVSRRETKILIKKAIKAYQSQSDNDYRTLGKYMFKVLNKQDNRKPEYVTKKD